MQRLKQQALIPLIEVLVKQLEERV